jgi:hypothetical protein
VLKGKSKSKAKVDPNASDEEMKPSNPNEIGMGVNGDVERQFKLLGFAKQDDVPRHHFVAGVDVVLPLKGSKNERAFAALVHEMIETRKVLTAKIIERKNAEAKLVGLYPHIRKR